MDASAPTANPGVGSAGPHLEVEGETYRLYGEFSLRHEFEAQYVERVQFQSLSKRTNARSRWMVLLQGGTALFIERGEKIDSALWKLQERISLEHGSASDGTQELPFLSAEAASRDSVYGSGIGWLPCAFIAALSSMIVVGLLLDGLGPVRPFLCALAGTALFVASLKMWLERLELRSGTYSYFDWRGKCVASFHRSEVTDVQETGWGAWVIRRGDRQLRTSSNLSLAEIGRDLQAFANRDKPPVKWHYSQL